MRWWQYAANVVAVLVIVPLLILRACFVWIVDERKL